MARSNNRESFFEKQWIKWTAIIVTISGLIGVGYACGTFKADIDCKYEQIRITQECNDRLNSDEYLCKTATIVGLKGEIVKLKETTEILKESKNEK